MTTEEALRREIAAYRGHLDMARREVEAGNERMRSYAEAYATHLDSLNERLAKNSPTAQKEKATR